MAVRQSVGKGVGVVARVFRGWGMGEEGGEVAGVERVLRPVRGPLRRWDV